MAREATAEVDVQTFRTLTLDVTTSPRELGLPDGALLLRDEDGELYAVGEPEGARDADVDALPGQEAMALAAMRAGA